MRLSSILPRRAWVLAWVFLAGTLDAARASTPPAGFTETSLVADDAATGASVPTGIAYEPVTGNLWVLEKGDGTPGTNQARVRVRNRSTGVVTTAITLACVDHYDERGLLGIAFPNNYAPANGFVFLYYTRILADTGACSVAGQAAGVRNRVSRFQNVGGVLQNETVILQGPYLSSAGNHNGGTLRFAPDGTLFVSMGDNDTDADANPASRDLNDLRGKLLRVNADGTIPATNPFVGQAGKRAEIWAWGLRNPFRFAIDSQNSDVYIADVGENTWEEIDLGTAGADYGYPCFEGPDSFRSCNPAPSAPTSPIFSYEHDNVSAPFTGRTVIGGPVYRGTAFPAAYQGAYFFGDYVSSWIRIGKLDANRRLTNVQLFATNATQVVDMAVSPAGCLTWVSIGGDGVRDICFPTGTGAQLADIDGSHRVDGFDLARLARAFGSVCLESRYDDACDLDDSCGIDGDDLSLFAPHFGKAVP